VAVTVAPAVDDKLPAGAHVYVEPPEAVKEVDDPLHTTVPDPALMVGAVFTVTAVVDPVDGHAPL